MTEPVVSIAPDSSVLEAIRLMLQHHISGLPVINSSGTLVGMVTEGDFLRRAETGTTKVRPHWLEFLLGPDCLAEEYVRTHARKVEEVMTRDPVTVAEDAPLGEVVRIMECRYIKRLPVMRGSQVVGIVSRSNLVAALNAFIDPPTPPQSGDLMLREQLLAEFARHPWAPRVPIDVVVENGMVELRGEVETESQGEALKVCAENFPGVRAVISQLACIEPII